jgi:hypothetical protein
MLTDSAISRKPEEDGGRMEKFLKLAGDGDRLKNNDISPLWARFLGAVAFSRG